MLNIGALFVCLSWLLHFGLLAAAEQKESDNYVRLMLMRLLKNYDSKLRPNYTGKHLMVHVSCSILSVGNLDALNSMFTLDMFFRQTWKDVRLIHNLSEPLILTVGTKHPADIIWVPDTVFINSVKSRMHSVPVHNHKVDIRQDGTVFWGTRVSVSSYCQLDLRSYPMDTQTCSFQVVSYGLSTKHLQYRWASPSIKLVDKQMAQFEVQDFTTYSEDTPYVAGVFSVLTAQFIFRRLIAHSVIQVFVPCMAIVCVSWVSFWVKRSATPARVGLCITTLLTISTIWGNVNSTLPRVNYIKAIDVFLITSFCFVFCTLLEYILLLNCENFSPIDVWTFLADKLSRCRKVPRCLSASKPLLSDSSRSKGVSCHNNGIELKSFCRRRAAHYQIAEEAPPPDAIVKKYGEDDIPFIEQFARVSFPLSFFIFNTVYWVWYKW